MNPVAPYTALHRFMTEGSTMGARAKLNGKLRQAKQLRSHAWHTPMAAHAQSWLFLPHCAQADEICPFGCGNDTVWLQRLKTLVHCTAE